MEEDGTRRKLGVGTNIEEVNFPSGEFGLFEEDEFGDLQPLDHELTDDNARFLARKYNKLEQ